MLPRTPCQHGLRIKTNFLQRKKKETRKSDKKLPKENHDSVDQILFKWLLGIQSQKYESRKKNSCYTFASIFSIYLVRFRCASYLKPAKLEWCNNGGVFTRNKVDALEAFLSFSAFSKKKRRYFKLSVSLSFLVVPWEILIVFIMHMLIGGFSTLSKHPKWSAFRNHF